MAHPYSSICNCHDCIYNNRRKHYGEHYNGPGANMTGKQPTFKSPVKYTHSCKELFSYVGVEPTFYPIVTVHPALEKYVADEYDSFWQIIVSSFETHKSWISHKHPWLKDFYEDEGCFEVRGPHNHKQLLPITRKFAKLLRVMYSCGFQPSSLIDRSVEGGCHINFNLADKVAAYGEPVVELFLKNLIYFLNNYPSLVWAYLAPEDNISSRIICHKLGGVYMASGLLTIRTDIWNIIEYTELRFFMMPKTVEEFSFHIRSADAILKYVWNITCKNSKSPTFTIKNSKTKLRQYTLTRAKNELVNILPVLGISVKEFTRLGKFKILKERFQYNSSYLV